MKKNISDRPLYKYTKYKFAKKMIEDGTFKIGTLYEFRNIEKHGNEIGDDDEGVRRIYSTDNVDLRYPETVPFHVKNHIKPQNKKANIIFKNIMFRTTYHHPDCYLFCLFRYNK